MDAFYDAILPAVPTVLGKRLKPFSVGHFAILEALGSPFISGGKVELSHCLILAAVCSLTFEEAKDWVWRLTTDETKSDFEFWGRSVGMVNIPETANVIENYISLFSSQPKFMRTQKIDRATGQLVDVIHEAKLPVPLVLATALMKHLHFTQTEAWNCPLGLAVWYGVAATGNEDSILSEHEAELLKQLKEQKNK